MIPSGTYGCLRDSATHADFPPPHMTPVGNPPIVVCTPSSGVILHPSSLILQPSSVDWLSCIVPAEAQVLDSCVGHATANWIECMLRVTHGVGILKPGQQIDGHAIWRAAREFYWDGRQAGGIYLDQGFSAAIQLGLLPPDTEIHYVGVLPQDILGVIRHTPLIQSHMADAGWQDPGPAGVIVPAGEQLGGHATLLVGCWQDGRLRMPALNSWGSAWGRSGCFMMDFKDWYASRLDNKLVTAQLGPMWSTWRAWQEFVIDPLGLTEDEQ